MEVNTQGKTVLLNHTQVLQRINTLAFRIYEDNFSEKEIILAGIVQTGFQLAKKLQQELLKISPLKILLVPVELQKHSRFVPEINISLNENELNGRVIILIDDVMNSGKTMLYALRPFLKADIKKIRTVVLIDRDHKSFPVAADFAGLTLSTTLKEHVSVGLSENNSGVWLS